MKRSPSEYDDEVIVTSVGFADRQASLQAAVDFDTEKAIADLYAHVARMPDSAHKRRLVKQVSYSDVQQYSAEDRNFVSFNWYS